MGRTEPTVVKPPAAFRRDARAKRARTTVNKVIPALLSTHPRARHGIERSELIVDPPPLTDLVQEKTTAGNGSGDDVPIKVRKASGRRKKDRTSGETQPGDEPEHDGQTGSSRSKTTSGPCISLRVTDTLSAAYSLLDPMSSSAQRPKPKQPGTKEHASAPDRKAKVGILNMASPLSPGGGFFNGATSQEEWLCMRTTLLPALRDEFYRLPEVGAVYTPDVLVFRPTASPPPSCSPAFPSEGTDAGTGSGGGGAGTGGDEEDVLAKNDRWFVDVVSAAMLRLPETEEGRYASAADRELAVRKMRAVLRVFAAKGCTRVVLGAWGCGVYGNPVCEIAEAWRRALGVDIRGDGTHQGGGKGANNDQPSAHCEEKGRGKGKEGKGKKSRNKDKETWGGFIEKVVFAIKDGGMAAAFARAFGEDILPLPPSLSGDGEHGSLSSTAGDEDEDPVQAARIHELRERIAQLEIQMEQARSPHLKVGLEAVLARLRKQLLTDGDHGNDNESSSDSGSEYAGRPYDGDEGERDEELEIPIETSHGDEQL